MTTHRYDPRISEDLFEEYATADATRRRELEEYFVKELFSNLIKSESFKAGARREVDADTMDDLVQTAQIGIVLLMRRHDPTSGAFAAYAKASLPGMLRDSFRSADKFWRGTVSLDEAGVDDDGVSDPDAYLARLGTTSTQEWASQDDTPESLLEEQQAEDLKNQLFADFSATLSDTDRAIFDLRLRQGVTLEAVAAELGTHKSTVMRRAETITKNLAAVLMPYREELEGAY